MPSPPAGRVLGRGFDGAGAGQVCWLAGGEFASRGFAGVHQIDDAVVFMMRDTQTGELVPCTISAAALSRLAGRPGVPLEDAFDENRLTIEAMASRMYDAGEKKPVIQEDDA